MKIDIHGCFDSDVHAICIKRGEEFFCGRPKPHWSATIEEAACFLSESKALDCIEEVKVSMDMSKANLIWTDSRLSIYHDLNALKKFEEDMQK